MTAAFLASVALAFIPAPNVAVHSGHVPVADHRVAVVRPYRARFERIAACESTSRWHIATGNGFYGGLQFTLGSWHAVGGRGYPHWHTRLEQMYRAVLLERQQGWNAWPVCAWR
jgi:hypothetical protein